MCQLTRQDKIDDVENTRNKELPVMNKHSKDFGKQLHDFGNINVPIKTTYNECAVVLSLAVAQGTENQVNRGAAGLRFAFKECDIKCRYGRDEESKSIWQEEVLSRSWKEWWVGS